MALTISPVVSGTQRRWIFHVSIFFAGSFVGALAGELVAAAFIGSLSWLVARRVLIVLLLAPLAVLVILREMGLGVFVPYRRQQVPEGWRSKLSTETLALSYGVMLGLGFATPFTSSAHALAMIGAPFADSTLILFGVAVAFGLGKTLVILAESGASSDDEVLSRLSEAEPTNSGLRKVSRRAGNLLAAGMVLWSALSYAR